MKVLVPALAFLVSLCSAQGTGVYYMPPAEEMFLLGMRQYAQKDYKAASRSFQDAIAVSPLSHRITASTIMLAKTHYALKDYIGAAAVCDSFIQKFPSSLYIEDARFTLGMCYYNEGLYVSTIEQMQAVHRIAREELNRTHSLTVIDNVASEFLSGGEVTALQMSSVDDTVRALLTVIAAEKYFAAGQTSLAKGMLEGSTDTLAGRPYALRANRLLSRIERGNVVKIGVLLPLFTGTPTATVRDKRVAADVLEGIRLALTDYEERTEPGHIFIELDVQDSRRDSVTIDSAVAHWSGDSTITGILGPIFSDETMHAAALAQQAGIPIVSPTATDEGISQIGPYVFQANTSMSMRGKIMAQYAVRGLGARTVAVLASNFSASKTQADSFAVEAQRLGAAVVIDRRYQRGATDLRFPLREFRMVASTLAPEYIVNLRGRMNVGEVMRMLVSFGADRSVVDSIIAVDGALDLTRLFGERAKMVADSLKLPYSVSYPYVDSLQYPVSTIDAMFCPISRDEQIGVITSQVAYFNLKTRLLGTTEWYNIHELEMNRRYADGVIFGSDRWSDETPRSAAVAQEYLQRYGKQINDNVLFGYDAMSLIAEQLKKGAITRDELAASLASVREYPGIRNAITLVNGRVNSTLNILQYKDGTITKLVTYTSQ